MITDINDETPRFKNLEYQCEIAENAPVNMPLTFLNNGVPEVYDYDQVRYTKHCSNLLTYSNAMHCVSGKERHI